MSVFAQQELFKQIFDVPSLMLTYLFLYLILGTFIKKKSVVNWKYISLYLILEASIKRTKV